jgi:hypothetical protein
MSDRNKGGEKFVLLIAAGKDTALLTKFFAGLFYIERCSKVKIRRCRKSIFLAGRGN